MVATNIQVNVVDRTANALGRISGRLNNLNKGLLGVNRVAALATSAIAAIGGTNAVRGILQTTARFQDLNSTLATVTGSAKAGAEAFDFVTRFSTKTQFGVEELTQSYIKLASNGVEPSEELLSRFANAAAVTTDQVGSLNAITDLYTRSLQSQTIELNNLERLSDRGFPVYDIIKDKLGVTRDQIGKFSKEVGGTQKILDAIGEAIDERFGDATERLLGNLSIQFSNLGIAVKTLQFAVGSQGLAKAVGETAVEITDFINNNEAAVKSIGINLTKAFLFAKESMVLVLQNLDLLAKAFAIFFGLKIAVAVTSIAVAFAGKLVKGIALTITAMKLLATVASRHPLIAAAVVIAGGIGKLTGAFEKLAEMTSGVTASAIDGLTNSADALLEKMDESLPGFGEYRDEIRKIGEMGTGSFTGLPAALAEGMIGASLAASKLNDELDDTNDELDEGKDKAKKFEGSLRDAFGVANKGALEAIEGFDEMRALTDLGSNAMNTFRSRTADAFADAVLGAKSFSEGLKEVAEAIFRQILVGIAELAIQIFILDKFVKPFFESMAGGTEKTKNEQKKLNNELKKEIGLRAVLAFFTGGFSLPGFADGGPVQGNKPIIVGEEGPEVFVPRSSGRIVPNDALSPNARNFEMASAAPQEVNVNFNIQTVDAESFDELLVSRRGIITSIINESLYRQGKRGLV
jgi:hypothetical protein